MSEVKFRSPRHERRIEVADWQDAEELARWHMETALAFGRARRTAGGADRGLDVIAVDAVAQVKHHGRPSGSPAVRDSRGAAHDRQVVLFYSLSGYTEEAIRYASAAQVALFRYDIYGRVRPVGAHAKAIIDSAHQRSEAIDAVYQRKQERLRAKAAGWRRDLANRGLLWAQQDLHWERQSSLLAGSEPDLAPEHLELIRERLQVVVDRGVVLYEELSCLLRVAGRDRSGREKRPRRAPKGLKNVARSANHLNLLSHELDNLGRERTVSHVVLAQWIAQMTTATSLSGSLWAEVTGGITDEMLRRVWKDARRLSDVTADIQEEYRELVQRLRIL